MSSLVDFISVETLKLRGGGATASIVNRSTYCRHQFAAAATATLPTYLLTAGVFNQRAPVGRSVARAGR